MAAAGDHAFSALLLGALVFVLKIGALGVLLAAIETSFAKLRIFKAPDLIGLASLLGMLAVLATYVVER
jgi:formate hydrogenlyase subunit 4